MRNTYDMKTMACPPKYLQMGTFYKYYTGEKVAPCLTIVIGGNHEASSHLRELYFGGWLAPRIYFLGYSGCITVKKGDMSLKVGGISGIYSQPSFNNSNSSNIYIYKKVIWRTTLSMIVENILSTIKNKSIS